MKIEHKHEHHYHFPDTITIVQSDPNLKREIVSLKGLVVELIRKVTAMSQLSEETKAVVDQVNERTNAIADVVTTTVNLVEDLKAQIDDLDDGASPEDLADMKSKLETASENLRAQAERLQAVGSDPANPVPEEPTDGGGTDEGTPPSAQRKKK